MRAKEPSAKHHMWYVRSSGSVIERTLGSAMWAAGIRYRKQYKKVIGRPDFALPGAKLAVFCDSSFWHGRGWPEAARAFKSNQTFWIRKIEGNIRRDDEVNAALAELGWEVIRFWDDDILERPEDCVNRVLRALARRGKKR